MGHVHYPKAMNCTMVASIALLWASAGAMAQGNTGVCRVKDQTENVAVVICPIQTNREALQAAGVAACKGRLESCNAWIWDDSAKAPSKAPVRDTDMPKSVTGSARAVWVNDSSSLIEVRKAPR